MNLKEDVGFVLILIGSFMMFFAATYNLIVWFGELCAFNIISITTFIIGVVLYKTSKRRKEKKHGNTK